MQLQFTGIINKRKIVIITSRNKHAFLKIEFSFTYPFEINFPSDSTLFFLYVNKSYFVFLRVMSLSFV